MASKLKAHTVGRFTRNSLARPTKCTKCESPFHSSLQCSQGRTPMERTGRVNPRRDTDRRSSRVEDPAYLAWLRLQPCAVGRILGHELDCCETVDPEHERQGVGMSQTASDRRAWPCCRLHHKARHALNGNGFFAGFEKTQLRDFIESRITAANLAYLLAGGVFVPFPD